MRIQGAERGRRCNCYTCKKLSQCKYENYKSGHIGVKTYQKLHTNWINPQLTQHELNEVDEMKCEKKTHCQGDPCIMGGGQSPSGHF